MQKPEINSLPKSLAEAKSMGHNLYFTGVACKHGHTTYRYTKDRACSACVKTKVKRLSTVGGGNARRWAAKTPEQLAEIYAKRKEYYYKTQEARLEERRRSFEKLKSTDEWRSKHRESNRAFKKANPGKVNANTVKRRTAKMHRTPSWLTADDLWMIEQAYELAALRTKLFGFSWHVDHVLPLQGKKVSGLHVPNNLQVIPWKDNVSKANRFEVFA
jgi:hypothetical protein